MAPIVTKTVRVAVSANVQRTATVIPMVHCALEVWEEPMLAGEEVMPGWQDVGVGWIRIGS